MDEDDIGWSLTVGISFSLWTLDYEERSGSTPPAMRQLQFMPPLSILAVIGPTPAWVKARDTEP